MNKTLIESLAFGVIVVVMGNLTGYIIGQYFSSNLPPICKSWNKNHIMEISLFITGMLSYLFIRRFKVFKLFI